MKGRKNWKRFLSVLLTVSIVITTVAPGTAVSAAENSSAEVSISTQDDDTTLNTQTEKTDDAQDTSEASLEEAQSQQADNDTTEDASTKAATDTKLYQDGSICIYNEQQLNEVGTGTQVHEGDSSADTFGTGAVLTDEDGKELTYAADGSYTLMNDIPLTKGSIWTLPEGFTGSFNGAEITTERPLYNAESNRIYVYNNYQLITINDPDAIKTVMSSDMIATEFGVGQVVYTDEEKATQLEYTEDHNYVLSKDFTEEMPEMKATQVLAESTVQLGGRDYIGQVHKVIDGKDYILIGNEYQLREIGENTQVSPILFTRVTIAKIFAGFVPYYPGDADFNLRYFSQTGIDVDKLYENIKNFQYFSDESKQEKLLDLDLKNPDSLLKGILQLLESILGSLAGLVFDQELVTVTDKGELKDDLDESLWGREKGYKDFNSIKTEYANLQYTSDANYIIFRDIDLDSSLDNIATGNGNGKTGEGDPWKPLMLSGDMLGQKNMDPNSPVTISNIVVKQENPMVATENIGVGFFGTISGRSDEDNIGASSSPTVVKNINLNVVKVSNSATSLEVNRSVIDSVLSLVGGILGGLLSGITDILTAIIPIPGLSNMNLGDIVQELLTLKSDDPDTYATGSFAGRVTGNVQIENCNVTGASVSNDKDMTGGFVGYSEGTEEYDDLSGLLGTTVKLLSKVLNIIPGIGLGDIITLLLEKDVPLGQLIPIGYYKPQFTDCSVTLLSDGSTIGKSTTNYNGGFVGVQNATNMTDCTVTGLTSVTAKNYAGGFAGLERDDTLQGALSELGVNIVPDIQSVQTNCTVNATTLKVLAEESYAGGVNGCIADSISNNSKVLGLENVTANQDYAGGFAGRATIGYTIALDKNNLKGTLLGSIGKLINSATVGKLDSSLLQLVGIKASEIHNGTVKGTDFVIEAKQSYAGGLIGSGDGTIIDDTASVDNTPSIDGLKSVSAGKDYAGGIAGALTTANGAGLLNEVVGLVQVQEYKVSNINLSVEKVTANGNYAGGAFGLLTGGDVTNSSVEKVVEVTANNYAGGFVGRAGVGSLVAAEGLNILGLNLLKIDNLLSFGNMMSVQIEDCVVNGNNLEVSSIGNIAGKNYFAGGFVSENNSGDIKNSHVMGLKRVFTTTTEYLIDEEKNTTTSYAGGFAARSQVGGLAEVGANGDTIGGLLGADKVLNIDGLVSAVGYLIPEYTNCYVEFTERDFDEAQVTSAIAGGFIGEMQGGTVDNSMLGNDYAVRKAEYIQGTYYAGGFAGKILSGGLAQSEGLSLLGKNIDVAGLLNLIPTYIPKVKTAGVQSGNNGLRVYVTNSIDIDVDSGTAGGYVGLTRGANISNSDVSQLATKTSEEELGENDYAIKAPAYAGGYVGKADIGSAAAVGKSLSLFEAVEIGNLTSAIAAVESKFESCDVYGKAGGFNVKSSGGNAGGYAGIIEGSNLNNSNSYNFEYIEGVVSAGGYAGTIQPGDVAKLVEETTVLEGLVSAGNLLTVAQTFIPRIWNSETTAVPCGGYVKATGESSGAIKRGLAGGYVGYNLGGQIQGNKEETIFEGTTPEMRTASAIRIRSVYGTEYAGGYTGLVESANVANTGNLSLLYGLIKVDTPLTALQAIYATEENTAVYGPLAYVDIDNWNGWVEYVGSKGPYADKFAGKTFSNQEELDEFLKDYTYGYEVVSPGANSDEEGMRSNGYAGGYAGKIMGAHITNGQANDLKEVTAWNSAGGFVGAMTPASLASLGEIEIAKLDIVQGLDVLSTFVSVIEKSGVTGYKSGATVQATGYKEGEKAGYAGGFAGNVIGGQIWGETTGEEDSQVSNPCTVKNVCKITAKNSVGGFAGQILPGSAASVDTSSSNALLNGLLNNVIGNSGNLVEVLDATIATIRNVKVTTDNGIGIVIQGAYDNNGTTAYAQSAGGFAGSISGAIVGQKDHPEDGIHISNLQVVNGGEYAGGFAGKADVSAAAEISGQSETTILDLLAKLGGVDVLDILRPYIYNVDVNGIENYGLEVVANIGKNLLDKNEDAGLYTGNAGGFIGALLCGTVEDSNVTALRSVQGLNYNGGFIGHMGKSGLVDVDGVDVLDKLLRLGVGVADVIGSNANRCTVTGIDNGFTVKSSGGESEIAGGFVGYGDLGRMESDTVNKLKQVSSDKIAGGFVGKTSYAYLVDATVSGELINTVSELLNKLLKELLQLNELQAGKIIEIDLGLIKVNALWDGKLLSVNLLGIPITASLVEGETQLKVTIGDSEIVLGYETNDQTVTVTDKELENALKVHLIKANRTKVSESSVTGIDIGYDVFGGGATNDNDGNGDQGYAGGFVGFNNEGLLENNKMIKADTIRGMDGKVGEFGGGVSLKSVWTNLKDIEKGNTYQVYRLWDNDQLTAICDTNGRVLATALDKAETINGIDYYSYTVKHMLADYLMDHEDWNGAYQTLKGGSAAQFPVNVYVSAAQADLMLGTPTEKNISDPDKIGQITQDACATEVTLTIQKLWMDNNNKENTRPDQVDVKITRDGDFYKDINMKSNSSDSNKDSWTWTETVEIGKLNSANTGYDKIYEYAVSETPVEGYVTVYRQSEDGYTLYIINYLISEFIQGDSVVIDFGLPVNIDVLANDRVTENEVNGQLVAVGIGAVTNPISKDLNEKLGASVDGSYGTAKIQEESGNKIIEYVPTTMQMDSFDQFIYAVQLNPDMVKNDQNYVYGSLNIIPATEIYYEDNFDVIDYQNGTDGTGGKHGEWGVDGKPDDTRHQDTDRPGMKEIKEALDSVYGNDTSYESDSTYSGKSSHVVTVSKNNLASNGGTAPKASFKFTGTGFDLISVTSGDSGAVRVVVKDKNGKQVIAKMVNTYYGYNYSESEGWKVDENATGALYQIPIIKIDGLTQDTYEVEIIPTYSSAFDKTGDGQYKFYLDAIRIYDPVDITDSKNEIIKEAYQADGELNSKFVELRDLLLGAGEVMEISGVADGIVFIDGNSGSAELSDYGSFGPKNEVYLMHDQAIAFYLEVDKIPESIQLSAKLAMGDSAKLEVTCAVEENDGWKKYRSDTAEINTAYDTHYDISDQCIWEGNDEIGYRTKYPIIISNVSESPSDSTSTGAVISLTNLNWTDSIIHLPVPLDENSDINLKISTDENAVMAAHSLISVK